MDATWTDEARTVLDRACARHGGWERWRALRSVHLVTGTLRGGIPWMKGVGRTFPIPRDVHVTPHARRTVVARYPDDAHDGVFDDGVVSLRSRNDGSVVATSPQHRARMRSYARWRPLDALYFFGYALWHYHTLPFTLGDGCLLALRTVATPSGPQHALTIALPPDVPTHCRRQTFHFDPTGLLVRHDYQAEVAHPLAFGAHFWRRYRVVDGIPIAMERHVVPAFGLRTVPVTALHAEFTHAAVELGGD